MGAALLNVGTFVATVAIFWPIRHWWGWVLIWLASSAWVYAYLSVREYLDL